MAEYDYLVVGAGLFGSTFAQQMAQHGKKILVVEKRNHIAGNVYTQKIQDINVHVYGAHIFHTNNKNVFDYLSQFATFNNYINSPVANYNGELFSLPFNMYTFNKMWNVTTPVQAKQKIEEQQSKFNYTCPKNLEEQAINLVGMDIYKTLIKGYTEKQWGKLCTELPPFIIKRLPVRFTFNNNYFNALYQGIPIGGYTQLVQNMLRGIHVELNCDFLENKKELSLLADKIIYTGAIDEYFEYRFGELEYRSLEFQTQTLSTDNFQGNAVVNYTDSATPYTRIIEHKWFEFGKDQNGNDINDTVITKEYSKKWTKGEEMYYPINDEKNTLLYKKYKIFSQDYENIIFAGRLGDYSYYDMDAVVDKALILAKEELP